MTTGTVRWFDVPKGYGLIKPDDGGVDVLVDICAVERAEMASLKQGQRLSFEIVHDERIGRSYAENLIASEIRTPPPNAFSPITPLHDRRAIQRPRAPTVKILERMQRATEPCWISRYPIRHDATVLLRQARDISAKVLGFVARQLHVWHLRMRIHQELCDLTAIESRFPCDCREGWSAVRATLLIVGDDVTGRAPVPSELLSAGRLGGHRGGARDRSPHAESQRRVTPKGLRPVAGEVAHDVASCPADAQEQCSSADRGPARRQAAGRSTTLEPRELIVRSKDKSHLASAKESVHLRPQPRSSIGRRHSLPNEIIYSGEPANSVCVKGQPLFEQDDADDRAAVDQARRLGSRPRISSPSKIARMLTFEVGVDHCADGQVGGRALGSESMVHFSL